MKKWNFFRTFISDIKVGALVPTLPNAVDHILSYVPKDAKRVAEYGPGDGVITRPLLERLPMDAKMIAIETNHDFVRELERICDPRLQVKFGDVLFTAEHLEEAGICELDTAISGIPFSFLKSAEREKIVAQTHAALSSHGVFIVYQFSPFMFRHLKRWFTHVKLRFTLPIFFIMVATKG